MGIRIAFDSEAHFLCKGKGPEFTSAYLKNRESYWQQQFQVECWEVVPLTDVLKDIGYDMDELHKSAPDIANSAELGYWENGVTEPIDFGISFDQNGNFLLNFNCDVAEAKPKEAETPAEPKTGKKRCYFWKVYKYHVDISQITLKGWVDWCNDLYKIQHGKPRPKNNRIFVSPDMVMATVKGRFWNKDRIERWLNDHGYSWTQTVETKYQYPVKEGDDVELVDSDAELKARKTA